MKSVYQYLIIVALPLFVVSCEGVDLSGDHNSTIKNPNNSRDSTLPFVESDGSKEVTFTETEKALRNPLKGYVVWPNDTASSQKYVSLFKAVIPWNKLENSAADGVEKINAYSQSTLFNNRFYKNKKYSVEKRNIKVNPVVVLQKSSSDDFSPSDMGMSEHNNQTAVFADRIKALVPKLAEAWDNDPRIGFVYMAIVGTWGEQWSTAISPEIAKALGDSFTKHFKNKKVLVRIPHYFEKSYLESHGNNFRGNAYENYYRFGMYWDAFAWSSEMRKGGLDTYNTLKKAKLWTDQPILGEVAFNVDYKNIYDHHDYPGTKWPENTKNAIHHTLTDNKTLDYVKDYIRATHCTALSWISLYDESDQNEAKAAEELQKIMGYRFVLKKANYSTSVKAGGELAVSFDVQNSGSAPFYYHWPVEVSLLDKNSKNVVWSSRFKNVDIRNWQPGDDWNFSANRYGNVAKTNTIKENFTLPDNLKEGEYIVALAIVDPAGMKPAVKFAVTNYYNNGRTPLGIMGVGMEPSGSLPQFDNISDGELSYSKK